MTKPMRSVKVILLLLFLAAVSSGQSVAEQLLSEAKGSSCGRPLADGKVFDYREGRISSVTKENVLVFEQNDLNGDPKIETLRIRLAGIDLKAGGVRLNSFLKKTLTGKNVTVAGNKRSPSDGELTGSVWVDSLGDLNQHLLKNNMAGFLEPDYEAISAYSLCTLRQAGEKRNK